MINSQLRTHTHTDLFCGFFIPKFKIPEGWRWMYWSNPLMYSFQGMAVNLGREYDLKCTELLSDGSPNLECIYKTGNDILEIEYGMDVSDYRYRLNMLIAFLYPLVITYVGYLMLFYKKRTPRQYPRHQFSYGEPEKALIDTDEGVALIDVDEGLDVTSVRPHVPGSADAVTVADGNINFTFQDISYFVPVDDTVDGKKVKVEKRLLNKVNGFVSSSRMVALLGESGAGKTTLLDVLAQRKNTGRVEGTILLNGEPVDVATFALQTAYVEQIDMHFATTTVREALEFSARARLPTTMSDAERGVIVDSILDELSLRPIAERFVGSKDAGGLSREQLKRLSIGVELVSLPRLLFLDEPTTGLDAGESAIVMALIHKIAANGRAVICTIHQPSTEIFLLFDNVLLLQRGGDVVYMGQSGDVVLSYFAKTFSSRMTFEHGKNGERVITCDGEARSAANPSELLLDMTAAHNKAVLEKNGDSDAATALAATAAGLWAASDAAVTVTETISAKAQPPSTETAATLAAARSKLLSTVPSVGAQFNMVCSRAFIGQWRRPARIMSRWIVYLGR
jgi:ABC-type multidrug transport system ATPase subunit